jgi:hypothetical protein
MDSIKFIPKNQKNIEELVEFRSKEKGQRFIYILFSLFLIYTVIVVGAYWYFVVQEKNKVFKAIDRLDSNNKNYYITDNLEQDLFNISDLINNFYDPVVAIKSVESAYVDGTNVSSFSYNKLNKSINIAMTAPSINDTTKQVSELKNLPIVSLVNLSAVSASGDNRFSFNLEIILK